MLPDDVLDGGAPGLLLEPEDEVRSHPVLLRADVEAAPLELEGVEGALLEEDAQSVGELDLAVLAGRRLLDRLEDVGSEGVGADVPRWESAMAPS